MVFGDLEEKVARYQVSQMLVMHGRKTVNLGLLRLDSLSSAKPCQMRKRRMTKRRTKTKTTMMMMTTTTTTARTKAKPEPVHNCIQVGGDMLEYPLTEISETRCLDRLHSIGRVIQKNSPKRA